MGSESRWKPYVPVAKRRAQAAKQLEKLDKNSKGPSRNPVCIATKKMAITFWGEAWCENLENYSDYSNRLPRGRTYARNGAIIDLQIKKGKVTALVSGSSLYKIKIEIETIAKQRWKDLKLGCSQSIHSIMDLLRGKLNDDVLERLTDPKKGMFPQPKEIKLRCSCPDSAVLCKHLAAVMYGIGNRLDHEPDLLFLLRGVDKNALVSEATTSAQLTEKLTGAKHSKSNSSTLAGDDLGALFGIELHSADSAAVDENKPPPNPKATAKKKSKAKSTELAVPLKEKLPKARAAKGRSPKRSPSKKTSSKASSGKPKPLQAKVKAAKAPIS